MPSCPLCRATGLVPRYDLRRVSHPLSVPGVVSSCAACGMWTKVMDPGVDAADVYGEDYAAGDGDATVYRDGAAARRFFRDLLGGVRPPARPAGGAPRLLDVGTGWGALLEEAADRGFAAEGVELCAPLAERARGRGLIVHQRAAEDLADDAPASFEVVTLLDVIEHLPDPLPVLAAVRRLLVPGGELVVYTPNHRALLVLLARGLHAAGVAGPVREIFGGNHVSFFDDRTLAACLERAGFELRRLVRTAYDPARPGQPVSAAALAGVRALEALGRPFGRVFRLTAYARPRPDVHAEGS